MRRTEGNSEPLFRASASVQCDPYASAHGLWACATAGYRAASICRLNWAMMGPSCCRSVSAEGVFVLPHSGIYFRSSSGES